MVSHTALVPQCLRLLHVDRNAQNSQALRLPTKERLKPLVAALFTWVEACDYPPHMASWFYLALDRTEWEDVQALVRPQRFNDCLIPADIVRQIAHNLIKAAVKMAEKERKECASKWM